MPTYVSTEKHHADELFLKVKRHTEGAVFKFQKLVSLALVKTVNLGNTVTNRDNVADFVLLGGSRVVFNLLFDYLADIIYFRLHLVLLSLCRVAKLFFVAREIKLPYL